MSGKPELEDFWRPVPGHVVRGRGLSLPERLRAARRIPQAIVKVASYARGRERVANLLRYISRDGGLELETESGDMVAGIREQREIIREWAQLFDNHKRSRDVAHMVYSAPRGTDAEALRRSVRTALKTSFADHLAVFAVHEDRAHPHAHVAVRMRSHKRRRKLDIKKADFQKMRETFAAAAREEGIMLAASPRASRGVSDKGWRQPVYHLRKRQEIPHADRVMVDESFNELTGTPAPERPWEAAMRKRHAAEKAAYAEGARELRETATKSLQAERDALMQAALDLETFGANLPAPRTRRERWAAEMQKELSKRSLPAPDQEAELELER